MRKNDTDEHQTCIVCREPINKRALICNKCNSRQDWRRHLPFSQSVLSLLTALFAVSGLAIPAIVSAFQPKKSDVRVTVVRSREDQSVQNYSPESRFDFQLYVANVGSRRGAIGIVKMRPRGGSSDSWEELDFTQHYAEAMDEMIEPGTASFLYYTRSSLFSPGAERNVPLPQEVELRVEVINEDASQDYIDFEIFTHKE